MKVFLLHAHRYVDSRAENGLTALHMAAALGDLPCVKILLGAGASMMVRTVDLDMQSSLQFPAGSTPLHLAAQRGQIAILQAMLQVGGHSDHQGTGACFSVLFSDGSSPKSLHGIVCAMLAKLCSWHAAPALVVADLCVLRILICCRSSCTHFAMAVLV